LSSHERKPRVIVLYGLNCNFAKKLSGRRVS
jgi:hypothetical protein